VTDRAPIFNVIIDEKSIALEKIEPKNQRYRKVSKEVILRQRDAIERFQKLKAEGGSFVGTHSFQFLDTAKTFAMLRLRAMEQDIQDNLDRIQSYDGSAKTSGG